MATPLHIWVPPQQRGGTVGIHHPRLPVCAAHGALLSGRQGRAGGGLTAIHPEKRPARGVGRQEPPLEEAPFWAGMYTQVPATS